MALNRSNRSDKQNNRGGTWLHRVRRHWLPIALCVIGSALLIWIVAPSASTTDNQPDPGKYASQSNLCELVDPAVYAAVGSADLDVMTDSSPIGDRDTFRFCNLGANDVNMRVEVAAATHETVEQASRAFDLTISSETAKLAKDEVHTYNGSWKRGIYYSTDGALIFQILDSNLVITVKHFPGVVEQTDLLTILDCVSEVSLGIMNGLMRA